MKSFMIWVLVFFLALTGSAFGADERDSRADELADKVMASMGGKENYDNTRFLTWRFFGRRFHVWDKWTGNIRVEDGKGLVVLMNVNTKEGQAWQDGQRIEDAAALQEKLDSGYSAWINDSYWLVMPYKLKDPGVHLIYVGETKTEEGKPAYMLSLTFESVGLTPENKYEVLIDKESMLVTQWNFYTQASDEEPRFKTPWANWTKHGRIMLSDDRGRGKHTEVAVFDALPDSVFTSPDPIDLGLKKDAAPDEEKEGNP